MRHIKAPRAGFTLLELSIVLVIIGLIVGGILTGRDLIEGARIRTQIAQIEKYRTAMNTFRSKYNFLPGDLPAVMASALGFVTRNGALGRGDGNGFIEGCYYPTGYSYGWIFGGEPTFFWRDLSEAQLIDTAFSTVTDTQPALSTNNFAQYVPKAKLGNAYVTIFTGCQRAPSYSCYLPAVGGVQYFGIHAIGYVSADFAGDTDNALSALQAYTMDSKVDDGLARSGRVQAFYTHANNINPLSYAPRAAASTATTCFETTTDTYSVNINGGNNMTCGISFQAQ